MEALLPLVPAQPISLHPRASLRTTGNWQQMKGMFLWVSAIHSVRFEPLIPTFSTLLIPSLSQSTCYKVDKGGNKETNSADCYSVGELKPSSDPLEFTQKSSSLAIFQLCYEGTFNILSPSRCLALSTTPLLLHRGITVSSVSRQSLFAWSVWPRSRCFFSWQRTRASSLLKWKEHCGLTPSHLLTMSGNKFHCSFSFPFLASYRSVGWLSQQELSMLD